MIPVSGVAVVICGYSMSVVSPDQVTFGVLVDTVSREAVDEAVAVCRVGERRSDGKLPAHVIAYLTLALCLFPENDYEEAAIRVTGSLDLGRRLERADRQCEHPGPQTAGPQGVSRVVRADLRAGRGDHRAAGGARAFVKVVS